MATPITESLSPSRAELKRFTARQRRRLLKVAMAGVELSVLPDSALNDMPIEEWFDVDLPAIRNAVMEAGFTDLSTKRTMLKAVFGSVPKFLTDEAIEALPLERWIKADLSAVAGAVSAATKTAADAVARTTDQHARELVEARIATAFNTKYAKVMRLDRVITGKLLEMDNGTERFFYDTMEAFREKYPQKIEMCIKITFSIEKPPRPPVATSKYTPAAPVMRFNLRGHITQDIKLESKRIIVGGLNADLWVEHNIPLVYSRYNLENPKTTRMLGQFAREIAIALGVPRFAMVKVPIDLSEPESESSDSE